MLIQFFLPESWESFAEVDKSKSHQVSSYFFFTIFVKKGTATLLVSGMLQVQKNCLALDFDYWKCAPEFVDTCTFHAMNRPLSLMLISPPSLALGSNSFFPSTY